MAKRNPLPLVSLALSTPEEVNALLHALCFIEMDEDSPLAPAAESLIERIVAALPLPEGVAKTHRKLRSAISSSSSGLAAEIHAAILNEHSLRIAYSDRKGADTKRTIWPVDLYGHDAEDGMVLAWCETRKDFRNFRTDRIRSMETLDRYPVRRQLLLARWGAQQQDNFY